MPTSAAELLVTESYRELMPLKTGPLNVIEVSPTTMTVGEDSIRNTVLIDRANTGSIGLTRAATNRLYARQAVQQTKRQSRRRWRMDYHKRKCWRAVQIRSQSIVRHVAKGNSVRFVEHLYGYTPADDTVEPPEHIPELFITRYWCDIDWQQIFLSMKYRIIADGLWGGDKVIQKELEKIENLELSAEIIFWLLIYTNFESPRYTVWNNGSWTTENYPRQAALLV